MCNLDPLQERDAPFAPLQMVTLPDALAVSTSEVFKQFLWTAESFRRKTVWYRWAEQAKSSQNVMDSPQVSSSELFHFTVSVWYRCAFVRTVQFLLCHA
jgi:hypothetical protein